MTRDAKIGLLIGLAFIILFGIILSEKGATRDRDQLVTTQQMQPVIELVPPTDNAPVQLVQNRTETPAPTPTLLTPAGQSTPSAPQTVAPAARPAEPKPEMAPKMKQLLPVSSPRQTVQIPAANPAIAAAATKLPTAPAASTGADSVAVSKFTLPSDTTQLMPAGITPAPTAVKLDVAGNIAAAVTSTKEKPQQRLHEVKSGETLGSILHDHYPGQVAVMMPKFVKINKISDPKKLQAGQSLVLPEAPPMTVSEMAQANTLQALAGNVGGSKPALLTADNGDQFERVAETPVKSSMIEKTEIVTMKPLTISNKTTVVAEPVAMTSTQTYVLQPGDTLAKLARKYYGKESAWKLIYERNRKALGNPNSLKNGTKIILPAVPQELAANAAGAAMPE